MTSSTHPISVAVLAGGPDAEREVSLVSSQGVADALARNPRFKVHRHEIGRLSQAQLGAIAGDVIFPVLHGPWGEGGPLQDLLEHDGRAYVGCGPRAARIAMDKLATKLAAHRCRITATEGAAFNAPDPGCPLEFPVVVKPVHEGSSVGVHFARDAGQWSTAHAAVLSDLATHPHRMYMVERAVLNARELTVGVLDGEPLPPIEIVPKNAFYDFHAKYQSDETAYVVSPALPAGVAATIQDRARVLCRELGVRHLARVDFLLDVAGEAWVLEANTLPGFTGHSLFPMAAADRAAGPGLDMTALTTRLVELALRDQGARHGQA